MKKQLVILGHPNPESYCAALADAYVDGATSVGVHVDYLKLHELGFDPILRTSKALEQPLEDDLKDAQQRMQDADHWVWVYPTWWGYAPGLMKGFLDRTMTQGFAFQYADDKLLWDKLLTGRSAHLITTMNTPPWFYRIFYNDCGIQAMKKTVLGFGGIKTTRVTRIGMIRKFSESQRSSWIEKVRDMGAGPVPM